MPRGGDNTKLHTSVKNACRDFIRWNGGYCHCNIGGIGIEKGIPDIEGCLQGEFVAVEVKTGEGSLNKDQREKREAILQAGGRHYIVASAEEFEIKLTEDGFRLVGTLLAIPPPSRRR